MRNEIIIQKMYHYAGKLTAYCEGYTYDTFIMDMKLVEACVFNLSQLGELCRIVDGSFAQEHSEIPWREMYGLRNRIVHDYEGVNLRLVWEIISSDIPRVIVALVIVWFGIKLIRGKKEELDRLEDESTKVEVVDYRETDNGENR